MSPEQLLLEGVKQGASSIALTDINNTSGILDFFRLSQHHAIKPIAGIDFRNGVAQQYVGLAKNIDGFNKLNRFLSAHLHAGSSFPAQAPSFENVFIVYPATSSVASQITKGFLKENEFIGISPSEISRMPFSKLRMYPEKLVIMSTVTFRNKTDFNTHRLLRAIDKNTLLSKLLVNEQANANEVMLSKEQLNNIYRDYPLILRNTEKILDECNIDFEFGVNKNKKYFTGSADGDREQLLRLCEEGLFKRYPATAEQNRPRLEKEIRMIYEKEFASYFLINWDIVSFARHMDYYYVGRGSGANSIVAYILRITDVDPVDLDLYFERFINPSRINPPDFDIDFSWNERDAVIDYIFKKHGTDFTALLATYSTFQSNSVVRELGKVFGLPKGEIDALPDKFIDIKSKDPIINLVFKYSNYIHDFPNHLSIHAGGIIICDKPVYNYTATSLPPKNFPITQFSMLEAEDVGLSKFDILSQRGLGKIKDAVEIITKNRKVEIDIHNVERFKQDEAVRTNLQEANLIGCFYVESPAMRMLLTKLRASTYLDLVAASSIIRPGVAQSGMMREYILRFHDPSRRKYILPLMEELMKETFGVMVYQEDVIKVAHHFAGLSLTEADMLRRGMSGKYRSRAEFQKVEQQFFSNCREKGYAEDITKEVWRQIESFAGYAFSKGHSASYAVESYQCMFLKTYYPLDYMVAVINNFGGFYATEFYVHEARLCGAVIHAPDINISEYETIINGDDIYLGFMHIAELERNVADQVLSERNKNGEFLSLSDFMKRINIAVEQLRTLIRIGSFRFTKRSKKQLLWDIHTVIGSEKKTTAHMELFEGGNKEFVLPELNSHQLDDAFDELEILGFPLCSPFDLLKEKLPSDLLAADLKNNLGEVVDIVGYLVTRKYARTKNGDEMNFGTFLDRTGKWIDTTHFPPVVKRYPFTARRSCYHITGKVVEEFGFYSIDVMQMKRLDMLTREDLETKNSSLKEKVKG